MHRVATARNDPVSAGSVLEYSGSRMELCHKFHTSLHLSIIDSCTSFNMACQQESIFMIMMCMCSGFLFVVYIVTTLAHSKLNHKSVVMAKICL